MKLIPSKEVADRLSVCYETFRKIVKHQPDFPKPILLSPKARPKWRDIDIDSYLEKKAA